MEERIKPGPKPKAEMVKCEVMRGIGLPVTAEDKERLKTRADKRNLKFTEEGLTTMLYPNKPVYDKDRKEFIPGDPVYIDLDKDVARKLNSVGAVRVVI